MSNTSKGPRVPDRKTPSGGTPAANDNGKPKDLHLGAMFFVGGTPDGVVDRLESDGLHVAVRGASSISPADVCEPLGNVDDVSAVYVNVQRGADDQAKFERAVDELSPIAASTFDYTIIGVDAGVAHDRVDVLPFDPASVDRARESVAPETGAQTAAAPWEDDDVADRRPEEPEPPAETSRRAEPPRKPSEIPGRKDIDSRPDEAIADSDGSRLTMRQEAAVLEIDPADLTDSVLPPFAPTQVVSVLEDMVSTDFLRPSRSVLIGVSPAVALGDPDDESPDENDDDFWDEHNNDAIVEYIEKSSDLGSQYANDRAIVRDLSDEEYERTAEQVAAIVGETQRRRLDRIASTRADMADHMDEVNEKVDKDRSDYLDGLKNAMVQGAIAYGQAFADENKARTMRDCDEYMAEHAQMIARGLERQSLDAYTTLVGADRACDDPGDLARILGTDDFDARNIRAYLSVLRFRSMNDRSLARLVDALTGDFESSYIVSDDAPDTYLPVADEPAEDGFVYDGYDASEPDEDMVQEEGGPETWDAAETDGIATPPVEVFSADTPEPAVQEDDDEIEESLPDETTSFDRPSEIEAGDDREGDEDGAITAPVPVDDDLGDLDELDLDDGFDVADDQPEVSEEEEDAVDESDTDEDDDDDENPYGTDEPKKKRRMKLPVKIACGIGAAALVAVLGIGAARAGLLSSLGIPGADTQQVETQQDDPQGTYRAGDQYKVNITGSDGQPQETTVTIDGFEPDGTVHTKDADGNSYTISRDKMDAIAAADDNKDAKSDGTKDSDGKGDASKDDAGKDAGGSAPDMGSADSSKDAQAQDASGSATAQAQDAVDGKGAA